MDIPERVVEWNDTTLTLIYAFLFYLCLYTIEYRMPQFDDLLLPK
jgi:hypothetical protein